MSVLELSWFKVPSVRRQEFQATGKHGVMVAFMNNGYSYRDTGAREQRML